MIGDLMNGALVIFLLIFGMALGFCIGLILQNWQNWPTK